MSSFNANIHETSMAPASHRESLSTASPGAEPDLEAFAVAFVQRQSGPLLKRTSLGLVESSESILVRTTASITGVIARGDHVEFAVEVDTGLETHVVYKRYSDIRTFRKKLLGDKSTPACHGVCTQLQQLAQVKFPRRRITLPCCGATKLDSAVDRMLPLEGFLQSLLFIFRTASRRQMRVCVSGNCAMVALIRGFFCVEELADAATGKGGQADDVDATERDLLAAQQELEEEKAQPVALQKALRGKQGTMSKHGKSLYVISEDLAPLAAH